MTTYNAFIIKTVCSGCDLPVVIDLTKEAARAGNKSAEVRLDDNGLLVWDCPVCQYADSHETD